MLITKYTSSKEIIENAFRTSGMQEEIPLADSIYWIYECMELLRYPLIYEPKVTGYVEDSRLDFDDYRVPLPCDFHRLEPGGISVNGNPVRLSTNSFRYLRNGECCGIDTVTSSGATFTDNFGNVFDSTLGSSNTTGTSDITATIHDGWINFNVQTGQVCLAYWAFPVDENNYPKVPDDVKIKRAISDYLIYKMDYIGFRQGMISKDVYKESEKQYFWSIAAAKSALKTPDVEQMVIIRNALVRLIPNQTADRHFWQSLGSQQSLYFR